MTQGKAKVNYLNREGLVAVQNAPSWDFLYEVSLVKNPNYNLGDRVVLPDGREFRYAKNAGSAALYAAHGCEFTYTGYTAYTAFAVSAAIGAREITIPAATHAALTEDELRGGYVIIFDGASDYYTTTRGIIGNDAAAANALFKIRLDAAITYAITASTSACEAYQNPYAALTVGADATKPKAGVPASYVSASASYFWVQVKGITWAAPQGTDSDNGGVARVWRHNGGLESLETAYAITVATADTSQYAGYCVSGSPGGNGPLFMLQG